MAVQTVEYVGALVLQAEGVNIMGKKLTNRQNDAVRRVASNMGMSDQIVGSIVSEYLTEQSKRPTARREQSHICPDCGRKDFKTAAGLSSHRKAKHES